jgi:hypothetical protein
LLSTALITPFIVLQTINKLRNIMMKAFAAAKTGAMLAQCAGDPGAAV